VLGLCIAGVRSIRIWCSVFTTLLSGLQMTAVGSIKIWCSVLKRLVFGLYNTAACFLDLVAGPSKYWLLKLYIWCLAFKNTGVWPIISGIRSIKNLTLVELSLKSSENWCWVFKNRCSAYIVLVFGLQKECSFLSTKYWCSVANIWCSVFKNRVAFIFQSGVRSLKIWCSVFICLWIEINNSELQ